MPFYEHVFITRHELSQTQLETVTNSFIDLLQQQGGIVHKTEQWGMRNLAYVIKKKSKAYYTLLNIEASSAAIQEMERKMRIHEDILRFLTVRVKELDPNPSPIFQEVISEKKHEIGEDTQEQEESPEDTKDIVELQKEPKVETPISETTNPPEDTPDHNSPKEDTETLH